MTRRGITLIELLVAILITGLVSYIAFDLIRDEQGNYSKTRTKIKLQSDAREAIRVIEEDLANIGYRRGLLRVPGPGADSVASAIHASLVKCDTITSASRIVVRDDNGTGSDTIDAQFYRPDLDTGVLCKVSPYRVRYLVTGGQLVRQLALPGSNIFESSVILDSVVTFQVRAAIDSLLYTDPTSPTNRPIWLAERNQGLWLANGISFSQKVALTSAGDSALEWKGWVANQMGTLSYVSVDSIIPRSRYQISCMLRINTAFRDAFTSLPSSTGWLSLSALSGADTMGTTEISLPTVMDGPTWVSWMVASGETAGPLKLVFNAKTMQTSTLARLSLGSVKVQRRDGPSVLNPGRNLYLHEGQPDSAFCAKIKAVRIWLVAKSSRANHEEAQQELHGVGNFTDTLRTDKRTYLVTERILPVVQYGY